MKKTSLALIGILACSIAGCGGGKVESIANSDPAKIRAAAKIELGENDWPWWSGQDRNFISNSKAVPTKFDAGQNCKWQYAINGEGHSSPVVVSDHVFLTVADLTAKTKSLVSLDRKNGKSKWSTVLHEGQFMHTHGKNSQASATPASDGKLVFTAFMFDNGIQVSAVDYEGNIVWQKTAGEFRSRHGFGSSPVIYRSLVIVAGDNEGSGFVTAMDRESGDIVWRINRNNESSYCTPVVVQLDDQDQLVISGSNKVHGYDPATGEEIWSSSGPAKCTANTVVTDGELVFAGGGYPENRFYCIDPKSSEVTWKVNLKSYVPSPIVVGDNVVIPQDGGILSSFKKDSGDLNWKKRLGQDLSGSGVLVGNLLYLGGERGTLFVVDLSASGKIIAKNKLDSRIMSTPAICGGQIFVRTANTLFCFANSSIEKSN